MVARRAPKALLVLHRGDEPAREAGDRLAWRLRRDGFVVDEVRAPGPEGTVDVDAPASLGDADAVILGGSLLVPEVRRSLTTFVAAHAAEMATRVSVLFVTRPGPAADSTRLRRARASVTTALGWEPRLEARFGGAVPAPGAAVTRLLPRRQPSPLDEEAVEALADRVVAEVRAATSARARPALTAG